MKCTESKLYRKEGGEGPSLNIHRFEGEQE